MTATVEPTRVGAPRLALPTWARWALYAAIGVAVLTVTQALAEPETDLLTTSQSSGAMLRWAVPIMLAALGGVFSERAGVVNIGLEGMMILGTWFGAWGALEYGPWAGMAIGAAGGAAGGLLHAVATVSFGVDHIISGVAVNLLAPGVARYLSDQVFTGREGGSITQSPGVDGVSSFSVPFLAGGDLFGWRTPDLLGWFERHDWFYVSDLAGMARGLVGDVSWLTLLAFALVPLSTWLLWRTRFGLRLRSCGEHPVAAETLGVDVYRYKYYGVVISGALAGLGGAYIVIELTSIYKQGQTQGRGFIGLATLIFGNWHPVSAALGSLLFGFVRGLQLRDLSGNGVHALLLLAALALAGLFVVSRRRGRRTDAVMSGIGAIVFAVWYLTTDSVPQVFPPITPFIVVLLVLIFRGQKLRMPAADGMIYRKGEHT
ncbi:MAG: ABC transporter permease [Actinomyces sp.]|nr:MAG: ABC transporter permease [Actinomyces sp.]